MRVGIVAGEASGDLLAANLMHALKNHYPEVTFEGVGGPLMEQAGCTLLYPNSLDVMGLIEPLFRLPKILKLRSQLVNYFIHHPPDVFIGVDAPDFNLSVEVRLKKAGIKVIHYVSPSVWAWRQKRVHTIKKATHLILTLFPFEAGFYHQHNVPVYEVGHPLAAEIPFVVDQVAAQKKLGLESKAKYVALLPGSRSQELRYMSAEFLRAAMQIKKDNPQVIFLTSHVNELRYREFYKVYQKVAKTLPLHGYVGNIHDVLAAADVVVVTSGTATLQTMLYKKPMVIAYKMSKLIFPLVKRLVKAPFAGLPNLLANECLVPELIQEKMTAKNIAEYISHYLQNEDSVLALKQKFTEMHKMLYKNSAEEIIKAFESV